MLPNAEVDLAAITELDTQLLKLTKKCVCTGFLTQKHDHVGWWLSKWFLILINVGWWLAKWFLILINFDGCAEERIIQYVILISYNINYIDGAATFRTRNNVSR